MILNRKFIILYIFILLIFFNCKIGKFHEKQEKGKPNQCSITLLDGKSYLVDEQYNNISELKLGSTLNEKDIIKTEKDSAYMLNYWDRSKHILLKKKNVYLNLILNLMRGSVTERRFGIMPNFLLNYCLKENKIKKNLKNPFSSYIILYLISISDLIREKISKPLYRSLPTSFKIWYDKARYRI